MKRRRRKSVPGAFRQADKARAAATMKKQLFYQAFKGLERDIVIDLPRPFNCRATSQNRR
jgi:hypothetical protein